MQKEGVSVASGMWSGKYCALEVRSPSFRRPSKAHHGCKGDSARGVVVDGDKVDGENCTADNGGQEEGAQQRLLDPLFAAESRVQAAAKVAVDRRGGRVDKDARRQYGATSIFGGRRGTCGQNVAIEIVDLT